MGWNQGSKTGQSVAERSDNRTQTEEPVVWEHKKKGEKQAVTIAS